MTAAFCLHSAHIMHVDVRVQSWITTPAFNSMEHNDTEQTSSSDDAIPSYCHPFSSRARSSTSDVLEKSMPNIAIGRDLASSRVKNHTDSAELYHDNDDHTLRNSSRNNKRISPNMIANHNIESDNNEEAPPQFPLDHDELPPPVRLSPRDTNGAQFLSAAPSYYYGQYEKGLSYQEDRRRITQIHTLPADIDGASYGDDHESISNSNCVPVEGRLFDLSDHNSFSDDSNDDHEEEEGGIVILDESTEEEYEEPIQQHERNQQQQTIENCQASMGQYDTILLDAQSRIKANPIHTHIMSNNDEHDEAGFAQLLAEAGDDHFDLLETEEDDDEEDDGDATRFWPFSTKSRTKTTKSPSQGPTLHTSVRSTTIRHDKFVVEVYINITGDGSNSRILGTRDVMDIMANMELLPSWFDPVPAVFEALVKDGSGSESFNQSPSNSLEEEAGGGGSRQYDGQWVEISTPPLRIPNDKHISRYFRFLRIGVRSVVGFPARIRSMIFVERGCCCRMGMTLGPYPDGFMCSSGTTAHHTFTVRMSDDDETSVGNENHDHRRCIVVSDEVRLSNSAADSDFSEMRRSWHLCCFLFGLFERLFRWYQPDLASYLQQTITSMDKLRLLVERGETDRYATGSLETPLLG